MPTELNDEAAELIRERASEYGTTTGRPRRCGWFDTVAARLSNQVNGLTGMALTRLDVLDTLPELKVCTAYELDGETIEYFPSSAAALEKCKPVYETLSGWMTDTTHIKDFDKLPPNAKNYINRLEELIGCPADLVCVGPAREQRIEVRPVV
jgi:adenylosuccinate synthase